ncbi:heavy metal-associated isoprenylated plant protein 3-like [Cynara cardunculus var. scolymus]|uniref:HMA domain-containing protein n=1 Tax=Cynara cardunculus var. scolymus TaxID=59895 RepID=A0A118K087_CYNCS|nr:heavy metal-associated isoprenylated plant protein 3-like [Cynara cardunculus var. scolymus]KVI00136.1 hypothetical protein Ccrd_021588 [Cynara cardunculus var. scolymus]
MAKKKNQNNNNENEDENQNENENGDEGCGGGKKQKATATGVTVVVFKMDLHCEGCAGRVVKAIRALDGVESVRIGDSELSKITVIGNLDPVKLRQKVEEKTNKKVELISPTAKKNNDGDNTIQSGGGGDNKKQQRQPPSLEKPAKTAVKKDEKKPKEIPVTTAVLKVPLHCQGCVRRIHKLVTKTKGYMEMSIDKNKDLVMVKGAIDMKLLVEALQHKLRRAVEIVPQKKDGGAGDDGGEKKGKGGGGEKKGKDNDGEGKGGEKKGKGGGGGGEGNDGGGKTTEVLKMENHGAPTVFPYPQYAYGSGYADYVHAPQLFSDENPHACSLM